MYILHLTLKSNYLRIGDSELIQYYNVWLSRVTYGGGCRDSDGIQ